MATCFEKIQAEDVVSLTPGVIALDNDIDVIDEREPCIRDAYVDRWDADEKRSRNLSRQLRQTDWEIRQAIQDELRWSPFVDDNRIKVTVLDGVATLSGEVETWNEWNAATQNALEGGALRVENLLRVNHDPRP